MDLFVASILLLSHIVPIAAMNSASLSNQSNNNQFIPKLLSSENQPSTRDDYLHNYPLDEENSMMSSLGCTHEDNVALSSSSGTHDQAAINLMVLNLMNRASKQDEIIRQQECQINCLAAQVKKDESTRELLSNIYKKFPAVVYEINKIDKQSRESRILQDQQVSKLNNLSKFVNQFSEKYTHEITQLADVATQHIHRHERHEAFSKKLHESLCDQLKSNQSRAQNELKANAKNIKAFTKIDFKPVRAKASSSSSNQSAVHEFIHDQNFDCDLDADFDFDNLEEFSYSADSNLSAITSCASTSIDSELSRLRPKRGRDNSVDVVGGSSKKKKE